METELGAVGKWGKFRRNVLDVGVGVGDSLGFSALPQRLITRTAATNIQMR